MPLQPINTVALDGYDISVHGFQTQYFCVWDTDLVGIEVVVQGGVAPTGTFIIEVSCEELGPANFSQIISEDVSITDNSLIIWNLSGITYNWVRVVYNRTSGSGEAIVIFNKKTFK